MEGSEGGAGRGKCGRSGWEFVSSRQEGMRKAEYGLQMIGMSGKVSRNQKWVES